ncbi:MAG: hypothetical protein DI629_14475 [Mesorhizobium amorphae]|nr:MAG: hypothetical protein DI629_14475 [Mesorhizobium amorphae]
MAKTLLPRAPVLVVGLGRAGDAALRRLLPSLGANGVAAWDSAVRGEASARATRWRSRGVAVTLGGDGTGALLGCGRAATIVKSPGIDPDIPVLRLARELGVQVLDELEIGWRLSEEQIVAVTGTNGKSTTCRIIASILGAAGQDGEHLGNTEFGPPLSGATPGRMPVCEVSSFQLEAAPTFLPAFAVFTNLSLEHLPRHGTMKAYGDAKSLMFVRRGRTCGTAIVNIDDEHGQHILARVRDAGGKTISFGFSRGADIRVVDARWTMRDAVTELVGERGGMTLRSRLPGRHNALNIAAAVAFGIAAGLDDSAIVAGVEAAAPPPGRHQLIDEGQLFEVVVDYAHTPDGIAQFLGSCRRVAASRGASVRTVFGATGLPDTPKALGMGMAAATFSDQLILTTGTAPRSPRIVRLRELRDAAAQVRPVQMVLDRRRAIECAVASAEPGDVVAILGLGALRRLVLDGAGTTCPFDDREAAREALRSLSPCAS